MKSIVLEGEPQKFENLNQLTSDFDEDKLPYEVEIRVYVVNTSNTEKHHSELTDEEFQDLAEQEGRVYTLDGFSEAFNYEDVNSSIDVIRFINVTLNK